MIWKPKEKELTPEEAVAIAKKELAPFWFGSPPLIAGIEHEEQILLVPLDKDFFKKSWMIFFIDPTDFEGENAIIHAKEWYRRYHLNNLNFIIVIVPSYDYLRKAGSIQKLMERHQVAFPIALDALGAIASAMNAVRLPKIDLLEKGKVIEVYEGKINFANIELRIQKLLRSMDPGLALLPLFIPKVSGIQNVEGYEFGFKEKPGVRPLPFPAPGFTEGDDGVRRAKFLRANYSTDALNVEEQSNDYDDEDQSELAAFKRQGALSQFIIIGEWQQYAEGIATADSGAYIQFMSPAERVSIIAAPIKLPGVTEIPRVTVEVSGQPVYDSIAGEDVKMEESGETQLKVIKPLLYHILVGLTKGKSVVGLKFPNAKRAPIVLYGVRFGEDSSALRKV